jgi:hypothetical protein
VVSVDEKTVFLPAKGGGVEAVDLTTGKVLWQNKDANKLAGASDKMVFAWLGDEKKPNSFRVFALDAATGKTLAKSDAIVMSDWVATAKVGGRSFRIAAKAEGEAVVVAFQANAFYYGGVKPTLQLLEAAKKEERAFVTMDVKTSKLTHTTAKPKDDDFRTGPSGFFNNKLGDYEFQVSEEIPGFPPGASTVTKVTFKVRKGGKEVWTRELPGNPWSPPPP